MSGPDNGQHTLPTHTLPTRDRSPSTKEKDLDTRPSSLSGESGTEQPILQKDGVTKIEALYHVFGKKYLWVLWGSIFLVAYVFSLQSTTTGVYLQFATSTFGRHSMLGTISIINKIIAAVIKPVIARCADFTSRPTVLTAGLFFFVVGYIVVAAAQNVNDLAGGEVLYTIGSNTLGFIRGLLVADLTSLQNRGLVSGIMFLPFVPNGFIAGYIAEGIGGLRGEGWRWGYGMFCILVPVCMAPAIAVLYWGQWRATRLGALTIADQNYALRTQMKPKTRQSAGSIWKIAVALFWEIDIIGLIVLAFALGCFLVPFSLAANADGGYRNPSMIALLVCGILFGTAFIVYEAKFAPFPVMPRRVLNRTLVCMCLVNFFYWFSYYTSGIYQSSWVYVVTDWSDRDYVFWDNTINTATCIFGFVAGLIMRYTHRYKYMQFAGICLRVLGMILSFCYTYTQREALIIIAPIFVGTGAALTSIASSVAAQASVPHDDLAIAQAILALITSIGGATGGAIGAAIWTQKLPAKLAAVPGVSAADAKAIYGSITKARAAVPRAEVIRAYLDTAWYMELPAFLLAMLSLPACAYATNFYLGEEHNSVETKKVVMRPKEETTDEVIAERVAAAQEEARAKLSVKTV